ncbi:MAG: acylphosphatase [Methanosarcinales archaeon]
MYRKYYNVLLTGNVQDIGFRKFIENTANSYHVTGYVFNDQNGSVKMQCRHDRRRASASKSL